MRAKNLDARLAALDVSDMTCAEIAAKLGCSASGAYGAMRRAGLVPKSAPRGRPKVPQSRAISGEEFVALYDPQESDAANAKRMGLNRQTFRRRRDWLGLPRRPKTRDLILRLDTEGMTLQEIADALNVGRDAAAALCVELRLPRRRARRKDGFDWDTAEGRSAKDVAREIGRSLASVRCCLSRNGFVLRNDVAVRGAPDDCILESQHAGDGSNRDPEYNRRCADLDCPGFNFKSPTWERYRALWKQKIALPE